MITPDEIEKTLASLPAEKSARLMMDLEHLLAGSSKKAKVKRSSKSASTSPIRIRINRTQQVISKKDILQHFSELHLKGYATTPSSTIKSDFVGICEMLAVLEDDIVDREKWRHQAAKVLMIDRVDDLVSYMTTIALGIKTT